MSKPTIDIQLATYKQLASQHLTLRREQQALIVSPLQILSNEVHAALAEDERVYHEAKKAYHKEYNLIKRAFTHEAAEHEAHAVQPFEQIYHQRKNLATQVSQLLKETTSEVDPVEIRTHWNGSIAVVYNPITGHAEWRQSAYSGVHGVFNPKTETIEWRETFHSGIYGVFNPHFNEIEWKTHFKGGVHGVYNPSTGIIEWKTAFHAGIGGVYNPLTKEIEWKEAWHGGVVGYFDYETNKIEWREKWHHGIALIAWNPIDRTYFITASSGYYGEDD